MSAEQAAIVTPPPGVYQDVSFEEYCAWDAANSHLLNHFARTPMHVLHEMLSGEGPSTRAKDLGWLTHLAILEPERFSKEVAVPPKVRKQGKKNLEIWAQWYAEHPDSTAAAQSTLDKVRAMRDAVMAHPTAAEFFNSKGPAEVSLLWDEKDPGVRCKARIDKLGRVGGWPVIGDLKTAIDAGRRAFESTILRFGYHVQAAHYSAAVQALAPVPPTNPPRRFIFFVVESEAPHAVACYELDDVSLEVGERTRKRYLRSWRMCVGSNTWPGYGDGCDLASLPAWALKSWSSEND